MRVPTTTTGGALLDLDHIIRVGDIYEAAVADGRRPQVALEHIRSLVRSRLVTRDEVEHSANLCGGGGSVRDRLDQRRKVERSGERDLTRPPPRRFT